MSAPTEKSLLTISKRHMASDFDLEVVVLPANKRIAESVLFEAHRLIEEIEDSLSEYREGSLVYRLNHSGSEQWISMDVFLSEVLELSNRYLLQTRGMFSPFSRSARAFSYTDLEIDSSKNRVRRKSADLLIGFGAIGKGYALDQVASLLEREGFSDFRLSAGGSSWVFRGFSASDEPWEVAWAWSRDADGDWIGQRYRLSGGRPIAIGVSGTAEKGQHFFRDGMPAEVSLRSAFCASRSAAEADALSTGLIVGASREGEKFLTGFPGTGIQDLCLAYVDLSDQMFYNQNFENLFLRQGRNPQ